MKKGSKKTEEAEAPEAVATAPRKSRAKKEAEAGVRPEVEVSSAAAAAAETDQIRINELARELEVKSKRILDYLPEIGYGEKKTHSSSLEKEIADKVRAYFRALQAAEEAAEAAKAVPPPPVVARPAPPKVEAPPPVEVKPAAKPPIAVPEKPAIPPAAPRPTAPRAPELRKAPPTAPLPSLVRPAPEARPAPPVQQRVAPAEAPARPAAPGRPAPAPPTGPHVRPAARGLRTAPTTAKPAPAVPRPTKPAPDQPIYARKHPPRVVKPTIEKRFEEGERKLHPVRPKLTREALPPMAARRGAPVRPVRPVEPIVREFRNITITEGITLKDLSEKLDVRAKDLIKSLLDRGIFATINQTLDSQLAIELAREFNAEAAVITFEEETLEQIRKEEKPGKVVARPPVVTVMGHVDHGKTSLLDAIRETNLTDHEAGGITQHIGAYRVECKGRKVVFLDTPGHEAFTRMRARGAKVTDVVVLVVAADDGVMPQTLEAIDHARAAKVPILVAINKIDKPSALPDRVKKQLADRGLTPEDWGGDTVMVAVSAKQITNIGLLLEMILLVADLQDLKTNPDQPASGTVLEAKIDKGRGAVATVLVQSGTLRIGDPFIVGAVYGKVRAMFDDRGHVLEDAGPSTPVEVLGLQGMPQAGDQFMVVSDEVRAKQIGLFRQMKLREAQLARSSRLTLDQLHDQLRAGTIKELPIILKADVQGSVEVLAEALPKLSSERVKIKILHSSVGAISETDVLLASASNAVIIGFNVRPERKGTELAEQEHVDIRLYTVIYDVQDEIKKAIAGMLEPIIREVFQGRAEVRETFRIPRVGMVAGCYVQEGKIVRNSDVRVLRDNVVIYTGKVVSLRRFKDDVTEVKAGYECGATVSNFNDIKVGDQLEAFSIEVTIEPAPAEAGASATGPTAR